MFWTYEKIEQLRTLVLDDRSLSASAIGAELDITRSAVIGKANRLGLRLPNGHGMRPPYSPPKRKPKPKTTWFAKTVQPAVQPYVEPLASVVEPPSVNPKHVTLLQLEQHHCRWPFGDSPYSFCGCQKKLGYSYCDYHVGLSTNDGKAVRVRPLWQQFERAA